MRNRKGAYRVLAGDLRERDHMEDLGASGRAVLKCMFKKGDGETWIGLIWLRIGSGGWRF
jgi:hypothetical protein